jgi:uncharacterized protein (DUF2141 family)
MKQVAKINDRIVLCLVFLVVSLYNVKAQNKNGENYQLITVQVTATGFKGHNGQAILNIFMSSDGFPSDFSKAYKSMREKIIESKVTFNVELAEGTYGFRCVHDENSNNRMEKNVLGIPKEGAGLSNYSQGGYPSFNKAKVSNYFGHFFDDQNQLFMKDGRQRKMTKYLMALLNNI